MKNFYDKFSTLTINFWEVWRLEDVFARPLKDVLKMSWYVFGKTSWRCLEEVLKTSWRCLETFLQDVLKTLWLDVLKKYGQDEYTGLDHNVLKTSWRRMSKANMFVLIKTLWIWVEDVFWRRGRKTSSRRLHQDECLLDTLLIVPVKSLLMNLKLI